MGYTIGLMKKTFLSVLIILFAFSSAGHAGKSVESRLDDGAVIKKIETPEDSKWAYLHVTAVVDVPPDTLWKIIIDIDDWPNWLPMSQRASFISDEAEKLITPEIAADQTKVYEIDKENPNTQKGNRRHGAWHRTVIEEYDLVWPIKNEWLVRRYDFDDTKFPMTATWYKLARNDGKLDGTWEVEPWKDGKRSLLTYDYRVRVKKGIPRPIFRTAISLTVNPMIKSLRRKAAKRL